MTPQLIVGIDPDSVQTALAQARLVSRRAKSYRLTRLDGGGSSLAAVPWSSISGVTPWLHAAAKDAGCELAEIVVVVETQAASGPRSKDVEPLRRVRYHWDAACEQLGVPCVHVDKAAWQTHFVPLEIRKRGVGALKEGYQVQARVLTGGVASNEDQCAALGVLSWYVHVKLGGSLACK